jgi:exonuclease III
MDTSIHIKHLHLNFGIRNASFCDKNDVKILFININRLANKIPRLEFFLNQLNISFEVIMLCETWVRPNEIPGMNLKGYRAYHKLRPYRRLKKKHPGGVAIFVKDSLNSELISSNFIESINSNGHEFLMVKINEFQCNFCVTYRQPSSNVQDFIEKLDNLLDSYKQTVVAGDNNINILDNSSNSTLLLNTGTSNGFHLLNSRDSAMYTHIVTKWFQIVD